MTPKAVKQYLAAIGRKGGAVKSEAKTAAVRANGARGGRPPLHSKRARLKTIRARIEKGLSITPRHAALHYADKLGPKKALAWARKQSTTDNPHRPWWDAVVAALERGVR